MPSYEKKPKCHSSYDLIVIVCYVITVLIHAFMTSQVTDADGDTLLSRAVRDGQEDVVHLLLEHGAEVNHLNKDLNSPLILAVDHGHARMVVLLIQAGASVNCANKNCETPLKLAATRGNTEITKLLLNAGACPNYMSRQGDTALNRACISGNLSLVKDLIAAGADVNSVNNIYTNGVSPLILAAKRNQLPLLVALLQAGAAVNSRNNLYEDDDTLLIYVARLSLADFVHVLMSAGAHVNAENALGQSALAVACLYTKNDTVKCLLNHGAHVNQRTKSGDTPLILAAGNGKADICQDLIKHGAVVDAVNDHEDNALIQAARNGHCDVIKVLIQTGANLNHANKSMMTALRLAVGQSLFNCSPCLMQLVEAGVQVNSELHYAVTLGLTHVVKQLMTHSGFPRAIPAFWLSFIPSLPQIFALSPLCVALIMERIHIVHYFLDVLFLTDCDLQILHRNSQFRRYLKESSRKESLHFLDFVLPVPLSLYSMSLLAVSKAIGFDSSSRRSKISGTGLPPALQRKLLFTV